MSKLTLDEAIKHCLEVAEENDLAAGTYDLLAENNHNLYEKLTAESNSKRCSEFAGFNRQLAEWLQELKELRRLVDLVAKYAGKSEDICERYLPSINGDLCVTDGMGTSNCTCCGYEYRCDYKTDRRKNK